MCGRIASTGETRGYNKNCEIADSRRKFSYFAGSFRTFRGGEEGKRKKTSVTAIRMKNKAAGPGGGGRIDSYFRYIRAVKN